MQVPQISGIRSETQIVEVKNETTIRPISFNGKGFRFGNWCIPFPWTTCETRYQLGGVRLYYVNNYRANQKEFYDDNEKTKNQGKAIALIITFGVYIIIQAVGLTLKNTK